MFIRKFLLLFSLTCVLNLSAQSQQQQLKVGYVDTEYVFSKIPDSKQIEELLKAAETKLRNEFSEKQQRFQKQYAEYSEAINTMTDTARTKTERNLQMLNNEIQQFDQTAQVTLENTRKLYMAPVQLKIGNAIRQVALENGYFTILPNKISGYEVLLYADKNNDLSDLVIKKLTSATTTK